MLRFSSQPALGGTGYVITLSANRGADVSWFWGHARLGWRRTRHTHFDVSEAEYRDVVDQVDRLLTAGMDAPLARANSADEVIVACADGPGYLTERRSNGEAHWFRPQCSGMNSEIATYLTSWAFTRL